MLLRHFGLPEEPFRATRDSPRLSQNAAQLPGIRVTAGETCYGVPGKSK